MTTVPPSIWARTGRSSGLKSIRSRAWPTTPSRVGSGMGSLSRRSRSRGQKVTRPARSRFRRSTRREAVWRSRVITSERRPPRAASMATSRPSLTRITSPTTPMVPGSFQDITARTAGGRPARSSRMASSSMTRVVSGRRRFSASARWVRACCNLWEAPCRASWTACSWRVASAAWARAGSRGSSSRWGFSASRRRVPAWSRASWRRVDSCSARAFRVSNRAFNWLRSRSRVARRARISDPGPCRASGQAASSRRRSVRRVRASASARSRSGSSRAIVSSSTWRSAMRSRELSRRWLAARVPWSSSLARLKSPSWEARACDSSSRVAATVAWIPSRRTSRSERWASACSSSRPSSSSSSSAACEAAWRPSAFWRTPPTLPRMASMSARATRTSRPCNWSWAFL